MSLVRRRLGSRTYLYFKLPGPSEIYLGPEDRPDHSRVDKAMRYVRGRVRHYEDLMEELERLTVMHAEERRRLLKAIRPVPEERRRLEAVKPQVENQPVEILPALTPLSRPFLAPKKKEKRRVKVRKR